MGDAQNSADHCRVLSESFKENGDAAMCADIAWSRDQGVTYSRAAYQRLRPSFDDLQLEPF